MLYNMQRYQLKGKKSENQKEKVKKKEKSGLHRYWKQTPTAQFMLKIEFDCPNFYLP